METVCEANSYFFSKGTVLDMEKVVTMNCTIIIYIADLFLARITRAS